VHVILQQLDIISKGKGNGKSLPQQAWTSPRGSR